MLNSILEALLSNFLDGLKIASIKPKRIMLQTGAKNYGLHLGTLPSSAGLDDCYGSVLEAYPNLKVQP
jgi:hypothetical protein